MQVFERDIQCKECKGTGLFKGMGERDGWAVVCHKCKGSGCYHFKFEYEAFHGRVKCDNVQQVVEVNPGIVLTTRGADRTYTHESFGGQPYESWCKDEPFPPGSENREFCCPASWYQSADYGAQPKWEECAGVGAFSACRCFRGKAGCWERFDSDRAELERERG